MFSKAVPTIPQFTLFQSTEDKITEDKLKRLTHMYKNADSLDNFLIVKQMLTKYD